MFSCIKLAGQGFGSYVVQGTTWMGFYNILGGIFLYMMI